MVLYSHQREMSRAFHETQSRRFVVCCSRQFGKSRWLCLEAVAYAIREPGVQIRYAAPEKVMVRTILEPHMQAILLDCPKDLKPEYAKQDGIWRFPNGSSIFVAGCDKGGAERLRGTRTHLAIVDEAGFVDDLKYVVEDILMPQTLTTDGRILMVSTPAKSPAHAFTRYCVDAEANGNYLHRTIYDAKHLSGSTREEYKHDAGGEESSTWRREYLAQVVVDEESAVVPEFTKYAKQIIEERPRPDYCQKYVVGDIGFVDLSAWLFAYVDFEAGLLVIEDELIFKGKATSEQVPILRAKEHELWGEEKPLRFVDASELVRVEFPRTDSNYSVGPVDNRDLDATVNNLRLWTQRLKYRVHPRCKTLIAHLRGAVWNRSRTSFERMDGAGHFDAVASLMYTVKHCSFSTNPFPDVPPSANRSEWHIPARRPGTGAQGLARIKRRSG
jgi:hypothetical protein